MPTKKELDGINFLARELQGYVLSVEESEPYINAKPDKLNIYNKKLEHNEHNSEIIRRHKSIDNNTNMYTNADMHTNNNRHKDLLSVKERGNLYDNNNNITQTAGTILNANVQLQTPNLNPNQAGIIIYSPGTPTDYSYKIEEDNFLSRFIKLEYFILENTSTSEELYVSIPFYNQPVPDNQYVVNRNFLISKTQTNTAANRRYTYVSSPVYINGVNYNSPTDRNLSEFIFNNAPTFGQFNTYFTANIINCISSFNPSARDINEVQCITYSWDTVVNPYGYLGHDFNMWVNHPNVVQALHNPAPFNANNCRSNNHPINSTHNGSNVLFNESALKYNNISRIFANFSPLSNNGVVFNSHTFTYVYRGVQNTQMITMPNNMVIEIPNFLHTSTSIDVASSFVNTNGVLLRIQVRDAIPYISFDNRPMRSAYNLTEREVIFPVGTILYYRSTSTIFSQTINRQVTLIDCVLDFSHASQQSLINNYISRISSKQQLVPLDQTNLYTHLLAHTTPVHDDLRRQEAERLEAERLEAERLEAERLEAERLEAERLEAERLEAERLEAERRRQEAERRRREAEAERRRQEAEAERRRQEAEAERRRQEAEAERRRQQAEAERRRQQAEAERQRQQAEAERLRQQAERQAEIRENYAQHNNFGLTSLSSDPSQNVLNLGVPNQSTSQLMTLDNKLSLLEPQRKSSFPLDLEDIIKDYLKDNDVSGVEETGLPRQMVNDIVRQYILSSYDGQEPLTYELLQELMVYILGDLYIKPSIIKSGIKTMSNWMYNKSTGGNNRRKTKRRKTGRHKTNKHKNYKRKTNRRKINRLKINKRKTNKRKNN